jgi:hypothetical protein
METHQVQEAEFIPCPTDSSGSEDGRLNSTRPSPILKRSLSGPAARIEDEYPRCAIGGLEASVHYNSPPDRHMARDKLPCGLLLQ